MTALLYVLLAIVVAVGIWQITSILNLKGSIATEKDNNTQGLLFVVFGILVSVISAIPGSSNVPLTNPKCDSDVVVIFMQLSSPQMSLLMKWAKLIKKIHFWDLPAESAMYCQVSYFTIRQTIGVLQKLIKKVIQYPQNPEGRAKRSISADGSGISAMIFCQVCKTTVLVKTRCGL